MNTVYAYAGVNQFLLTDCIIDVYLQLTSVTPNSNPIADNVAQYKLAKHKYRPKQCTM